MLGGLILLLTTGIGLVSARAKPVIGTKHIEGKTFFYHKDLKAWSDANRSCLQDGKALANITSSDQLTAVQELTASQRAWVAGIPEVTPTRLPLWTDGTLRTPSLAKVLGWENDVLGKEKCPCLPATGQTDSAKFCQDHLPFVCELGNPSTTTSVPWNSWEDSYSKRLNVEQFIRNLNYSRQAIQQDLQSWNEPKIPDDLSINPNKFEDDSESGGYGSSYGYAGAGGGVIVIPCVALFCRRRRAAAAVVTVTRRGTTNTGASGPWGRLENEATPPTAQDKA